MSKVVQLRERNKELPDDLITVSQFALKYGCDVSYPYKLRDRGKLRLYHFGYYKLSEKEGLEAMGV